MTTDQVIKICRESMRGVLGDGSLYDERQASYVKGMVAMAYFQGDITVDHYHTLNAEVEAKQKGEQNGQA